MLKSFYEKGETSASTSEACIEVIAVHSGLGGRDPDSRLGPSHLRMAGLEKWLSHRWPKVTWRGIGSHDQPIPQDKQGRLASIARINKQLAARVEAAVSHGHQFLVLGGDHSCGMGTWSGVHRALRGRSGLGLVWIDAHMDAHVPETTPSGNWHGMPIAHLLGYGEAALTSLAGEPPAILPQNLCLVGQRSWEDQEARFLRELDVRVLSAEEVGRIGMRRALAEAVEHVSRGTAGFGVSLDLDVIDPDEAPGVGSPVPDGFKSADLIAALAGFGNKTGFVGFELVEFDPRRDKGGKTVEVVRHLMAELWREV